MQDPYFVKLFKRNQETLRNLAKLCEESQESLEDLAKRFKIERKTARFLQNVVLRCLKISNRTSTPEIFGRLEKNVDFKFFFDSLDVVSKITGRFDQDMHQIQVGTILR